MENYSKSSFLKALTLKILRYPAIIIKCKHQFCQHVTKTGFWCCNQLHISQPGTNFGELAIFCHPQGIQRDNIKIWMQITLLGVLKKSLVSAFFLSKDIFEINKRFNEKQFYLRDSLVLVRGWFFEKKTNFGFQFSVQANILNNVRQIPEM